ncbi:flavin reductase [Hamadaea tsunoensis]|uniref:flavin reductase n=1 Tax=Hamadaea tsunoensis TaxID=53368 RepID=UPI000412D87A|nr:flavin reductase [Hamadaea tsunoensis]
MDGTHLRTVLSQWPSGVAVVTTVANEPAGPRPHGMTASSFSSVSLDPPLVSVCLGNHLPTRGLIAARGAFAVSFLGKDQAEVGRRFAGQHPAGTDRFAGLSWLTGPTGCPVLADATGWLECTVEHAYPGGDHTIFVGRVLDAGIPRVTAPLLFHSRSWGQLADPLPGEIVLTLADPPLLQVYAPGEAAAAAAAAAGRTVYVADAFHPDREADVLATLDALAAVPGVRIGCAEETPASPLQVRRVLQDAVVRVRPHELRVRLHGHHRLGLVNALVAMKSGVSRFDAARDAGGGLLAAADLAHLARQLGVACVETPDAENPELESRTESGRR